MKTYLMSPENKTARLLKCKNFQEFSPLKQAEVFSSREHIVCEDENGDIIGLIQFTAQSAVVRGYLGIGIVTVRRDKQNLGVSKLLIAELIRYAREKRIGIRTGSFTKDGEAYLKHTIERMCNFHNVNCMLA